jgi:hypothetical protein
MKFPYESDNSTVAQAGSIHSSADEALVARFSNPMTEEIIPNISSTRSCRDPFFAALFLANLGAVAYYAIRYGGEAVFKAPIDDEGSLALLHDEGPLSIALCLSGTCLFASILCAAWLRATIQDPGGVLRSSYKAWAGVYIAGAVGFALFGEFAYSISCFLGLMGVACIWCAARLEKQGYVCALFDSIFFYMCIYPWARSGV